MKLNKKILFECFEGVKNEYFPKWDKKGEWNVTEDGYMHFHGLCEKEKKTISVNLNLTEVGELSHLLIHEICHALAGGSHGKVWQRRMIKMSELAKQKGNNFLAKLLIQDVEEYQKALNAHIQVYGIIEDWIVGNPELTYDQIMDGLAREFGGDRQDYEKKYKRCRKVYENAKKEVNLF